jgi:hypothetical protein
MTMLFTLSLSSFVTFYSHHFAEKFLTQNGVRNFRLILNGYHIHHSVFGLATLFVALIFLSGIMATIFVGYGIGNIWQHKYTHKRVNESGIVFITKLK